jgi:hypothetical protein
LTPYGHSTSEKPVDNADILAKAKIGANAIKKYNGTTFTVGSTSEILCN